MLLIFLSATLSATWVDPNMTGHFCFFDTEGLDYQTELGDNYDMITVLPHTLIAENVFLVVRDRLNPNEGQVRRI